MAKPHSNYNRKKKPMKNPQKEHVFDHHVHFIISLPYELLSPLQPVAIWLKLL